MSRAFFQTAWSRLRTDNDLAIITSYAACAVFGIAPFALYRYATGNVRAGTLDLLIVLFICLPVALVWRGGNRRRASTILAIINTVGCLASATVLGPPGLFWMYPALLGNFLLLPRWPAVGITALAFIFLTVQGKAYESSAQLAMFLVSATVSGLVAFVFSSRTESQRHELETLAKLDALTGVQNRRAMEAELQQAVDEQRQGKGRYGLAMLDLDHFKRINDELGHQAGDRALRHVVETLRLELRREEPLLRVGGEEFVLVLRQPLGAAWERMDMLRRKLERTPFDPGFDAEPRRLTLSAGMACCPSDAVDVSGLMRSADLRLRAAKRSGRNRVVARDAE